MSVGNSFKHAFESILRQMGGTVLVHKKWGTPQHTTVELRGLKNSEKNRPQNVMFQFAERFDITTGDVLQQKGAQDLWRVTDVEDSVHDDTYVYFETKVEKMNGPGKQLKSGVHVVVQGPNYGGIQVSNGDHSNQNMTVELSLVHENLKQLRSLGATLPVSELTKEELEMALDRIGQLASKPKSEEVVKKVVEKLDLVKSMFSVSQDIAALAMPYIGMIADAFIK